MKHPRNILLVLLGALILFGSIKPALAKDQWLQVRSKNFYLVGNASEKDIRKVGAKLEEFRETLRLLFSRMSFTATIPTNVIVFKSDSAFKPYKPLRSDGKADNWLAGYFQAGEDANYIAVSAEGDDAEMYRTIFHEYVHFVINTNFGKTRVPPWFNEGLAEYYSTFEVVDDQKVKIGLPLGWHIQLLQQVKLIPLDQLFRITSRQLHAQGDHSRTMFYAESWALIHYLIQGGKSDGLVKFLASVLDGTPQDKAFQDAFQMSYAQMESELRKYATRSSYQFILVTFNNKLAVDADMKTSPYSEAETDARLGDLLYHTNRADDAEPLLNAALKLDPQMSLANTTLGLVKMRQRKFDEARLYLEKATAGDQKNHLAYYQYAYVLSREGRDEFGFSGQISKETAEKIRQALKRSIAIAPDFGESYDLLAYVALVTSEGLDDAASYIQYALKLQPGSERYAMRLAELYLRMDKLDEALAISSKFVLADDDETRARAQQLSAAIIAKKNYRQQVASQNTTYDRDTSSGSTTGPVLRRRENFQSQMSEEQLRKATEEANIRSINEALRQPKDGETRVLGYIERIECKGSAITYAVKTSDRVLTLTSKDFQGLAVNTFVADGDNATIGCGQNISNILAVLTYIEPQLKAGSAKGELLSIEFVPKSFRLMTKQELETAQPIVAEKSDGETVVVSTSNSPADLDKIRRDLMLQSIRKNLRQPGVGEKREQGYLQKIECSNKGVVFNIKLSGAVLRLSDPKPESLPIKLFTPDLAGVQISCNTSILDYPAVVIYTDHPDSKLKTAGEVISVEFVPKNFTLN